MKTQQKVWGNIAPEWAEFKTSPAEHTKRFLQTQKGKILDLGSGSGRNLHKIKNVKMYLQDFSEEMINFAKEKAKKQNIAAEFVVSDLTKIPFEDEFFNSIICNSALHCVEGLENIKKSIKEIYRVLKKGGQAEISVWNKDTKRFGNSEKEKMIKWRDKGERYYYLFSPKEVYELFEHVGFEIIFKEDPTRNIVFIVKKSE